jgi:hypothetical protein
MFNSASISCGHQPKEGNMRIVTLILAGLMATSAARATDDFLGDWKLNPAKSTAADGRALKGGRALIELIPKASGFGGESVYFSDASYHL